MLPKLETADFELKVESAEGPVVVKYGADWCTVCEDVAPIIEKFATTTDVPFYEVDVDADSELMTRAKIKAIPALLFYKGGRVRSFIFGMTTSEEIQRKLEMTKRS
jgi:thioredoxin 1